MFTAQTAPHTTDYLDALAGVRAALDAAHTAGLTVPPMVAPAIATLAASAVVLGGSELEAAGILGTLDAHHGPAMAQAMLDQIGGAPVTAAIPAAFSHRTRRTVDHVGDQS